MFRSFSFLPLLQFTFAILFTLLSVSTQAAPPRHTIVIKKGAIAIEDIDPAIRAVLVAIVEYTRGYQLASKFEIRFLDARYQYDFSGARASMLVQVNFLAQWRTSETEVNEALIPFECLSEIKKINDVWAGIDDGSHCRKL